MNLDIAYLHYGAQSGVTPQVTRALTDRSHRIAGLKVSGPLEPKDAQGRWKVTLPVAAHAVAGFLQFGAAGWRHRWNTPYAFDAHSREASRQVAQLERPPDVVLQNGALFSPGAINTPYVLLLDHTRRLSMEHPGALDYGQGWRAREAATYAGAAAVATFSRRVARSIVDEYGIPSDRVHVVGAGANVFPDQVARRDDGQTLLFVGKDFERKGGPVLLRAFERLRRVRHNLRLIIAGPTQRIDLPTGALNAGFVPPEKLPDLFARATMFVLPTLREPFGLAYLDAMACGLPCIGTRVEAVPEIIEEQRTGLLVPPKDESSLADAIAVLLDSPTLARSMGVRGRKRVEAGFQWHHVAERLEVALQAARGCDVTGISRARGATSR